MNTEFPTRIPTIRNGQTIANSSSNSQNSTTAKETSMFQKQVLDVVENAVKTLKNLTDKVTDFFNSKVFGNKSEINVKVDNTKPSTGSSSRNFNVLHETMTTLKSLTQIVGDFFNRDIFHPFRRKEDVEAKPSTPGSKKSRDEDEKQENKGFRRFVKDGIKGLRSSWKKSISDLQSTVEQTTMSIGTGIGRVFGQGVFGNMIGKIITKALNFAVSKVLIGFVVANLPWVALGAAIIAAIYLVVKYSQEIWDAIKWVGYAIDQGIDAIIDILPWGKSKYEENRKDMAKHMGVSEEAILDYYGDTIRGRNQAYEDWKRMETDYAFAAEMRKKINDKVGWVGKMDQTEESLKFTSKADKTAQFIQDMSTNITNNYYREFDEDNWEGGMELLPDAAPSMTNIVNTTNNTAVSPNLGNNVYNVTPYSSLSPLNSDAWEGGMTKINW